jgi:predicted MFS family arabinose efflux permease
MSRTRLILPLVAATLSTQASIVVLAPIIVEVASTFGTSVGVVGQARAVLAGTAAVGTVATGLLIDRLGVRPLLITGGLLSVAGAGLTAAAPTLELFFAAQVPIGLGVACMLSGGFAGVGVYLQPRDAPWAMGYVVGLQSLAWIGGNPIIGVLADAVSWRLSYAVPAAIALLGLAAAVLLLPGRSTPIPPKVRGPRGLSAVLRDRSARRWTISELVAYAAWTAELTYAGAFWIQTYGVDESAVGFLLAIPSAAFLVASPRVAGLARRFGQKPVILVGGVVMAVALPVLFTVTPSIFFTLALICVVAVFAALRLTGTSMLGLGQLPDQPGAMMSARTASAQLGYMVGAIVGGVMLALGGFPALGLFLGTGLLLASLLVLGVTVPPGLPGAVPDTGEAPQLAVPD